MTLEPVDPDELRHDMLEIISGLKEDSIRWRFEIEVERHHIGMVSSYYLNDDFEQPPWESIDQDKNADENHCIRAVGIEICEKDYWGRGIGAKALTAFMDYYRHLGEHCFLLETWSGNVRMLRCAEKLGFVEVKRKEAAYFVNGKEFDAIVLEMKEKGYG